MECRHQISNTLLYNLSTRVFVNEDWCSSGLALLVHNLLIRARLIRIRIRLDPERWIELVDGEVLTSLGTEVLVVLNEGLVSVLFRRNE